MKKRFCLLLIMVIFTSMFPARAASGISGTVFFVEYDDDDHPQLFRKQDLSKKYAEDVCPADFYLIEGFTEEVGVRAAREHIEIGETEILTVHEDGNIQTDCIIKDPNLLHVFAAHGDDYYYCRLAENKEYCCEYVRLNKNGDTFVYPHVDCQRCFCPPEWAMLNGAVSPADNCGYTYTTSNTVSSSGRIAFSYYETILDETKDSFAFPYIILPDRIVIIDSDGSVRDIGEGEAPAWLNDDTLLFIDKDGVLKMYSVQENTIEDYKARKGKTITLSLLEPETGIAVSKDGKRLVYFRMRALYGADAYCVSLETGKTKRYKDVIAFCIINTPRVFFGE